MTIYMVVIHMPHKDIIESYLTKQEAQQRFNDILLECSKHYGAIDKNGASLQHCFNYGYYQINLGYFIQMYESEIGEKTNIQWLKF